MECNIVLAGLIFETNLGDRAIFETSRYLLKKSLEKQGKTNVAVREMDLMGRSQGGDSLRRRLRRSFKWRLIHKLCKCVHFFCEDVFERNENREEYQITLRQIQEIADKNTKAIIFSGGGIIKYKYQFFYLYIDALTYYAEKHNIPVMISAAGIEGFDASDKKCRRLVRALNRSCVKMITTRDDIDLLKKSYRKGSWVAAQVADPACSTSDMIPMLLKSGKSGKVGLGVVREGLFIDNGIPFAKQQMLEFWKSLYEEIISRGYECKLFGNGGKQDQKFAEDLVDFLGVDKERILLPRAASLSQLLDYINSFEGIIVGRLHANILAYSYGIPAVGLVWNDKQILFGRAIHCETRFFSVNQFCASKIVTELERAIESGYDLKYYEKYKATTIQYIGKFVECNL